MEEYENILEDLKLALRDGTITKEEARDLLDNINAGLAAADESMDMVLKGKILTAAATLSKIL